MILQSLAKLYDDLLERGDIPRPGWSNTKVGYALCLDGQGNLVQIVPLVTEVERNGKTVTVNQMMELPAQVKRSSGVLANFLCDNSGYMLGVDDKGKPQRSMECFLACKNLHLTVLSDCKGETAKAIVSFFTKWDPEKSEENDVFVQAKEELLKGVNLIFRVNGIFAHEDKEIAEAWQKHYSGNDDDQQLIQCLISGETDALELVHPALKGVDGAQSSGAALVSFNAPAFCSYRREQGFNAPIGKKAAFAYTSALNHLLADRADVQHIGDTTVVCWADGGEPQYRDLALACLFNTPSEEDESFSETDLRAAVKRLAEGLPCQELQLSPEKAFYILGLAPNAARLSVRFFWRSSFGELMKNVNDHHDRMQIVGNKYAYTPLWALLRATANSNSKDKAASPVMAGAVTRAIISGSLYPASLLENTMLRIRAERDINSNRAAIIKAYYLKNQNDRCPKEVLTVALNENSTNIPYTIGRLFAIYEAVQEQANPGINATIKDKYFNSVAATPAHILPRLNDLYQHHLKKLPQGSQIFYEKQVSDLLNILGEEFPLRLSLPEQGAFQLGYYHQKQKRFEKKENK